MAFDLARDSNETMHKMSAARCRVFRSLLDLFDKNNFEIKLPTFAKVRMHFAQNSCSALNKILI